MCRGFDDKYILSWSLFYSIFFDFSSSLVVQTGGGGVNLKKGGSMLENLRGMAVFASVVRHGSFSGAGKELGITTSAVSQQIRSLELDLGVILLHRSTRKLSLTEAGASLYESAKSMVRAAEEGRDNVGQLRDGLLGSLRIATTPELARYYILPALSVWINRHEDLSVKILTDNSAIDMIDERVDLAVDFAPQHKDFGVPLKKVSQILLASPQFLTKTPIHTIKQLESCPFIGLGDNEGLLLTGKMGATETVHPIGRIGTNDSSLALSLAKDGYGVVKSNRLNAKDAIKRGELIQVLPDYELPSVMLYAKTLNKEHQPAKVWRCLEVLTDYFSKEV